MGVPDSSSRLYRPMKDLRAEFIANQRGCERTARITRVILLHPRQSGAHCRPNVAYFVLYYTTSTTVARRETNLAMLSMERKFSSSISSVDIETPYVSANSDSNSTSDSESSSPVPNKSVSTEGPSRFNFFANSSVSF